MVTKRYYNLTGGLNTSCGLGTINQSTNRTESPEMVNVEYYKLSGLQTMAGNTQFGSTLDSKVTLGYEYILQDESYMIVCTSNGGVYEYDKLSTDFKLIYQFPTPTTRHSISSFNYGIIISNGVDDLVYYRKNRKDLLTGEVSTTEGSSIVTGTGTTFKKELKVGDRIQIGDNLYYVDEITDDTNLTIEGTAKATVANSDFYLSDISKCNAILVNSDDPNISIPIRGLALTTYRGRIWVGDREGRLFYSEVGNYHGWDIHYDAGAFDSFFEDNTDFVALGLWAEYLVAHKRERTYLVNASSDLTSNWEVKQYSEYTCDSQQSFVVANNGYYVFSREAGGIYPMLSRSLYSVLYQAKESSIKVHDSFDIINTAKFDEIYSVYHPSKKYIMFYIPMLNGIGSNECYILDIQTNSWLHRKVPQEVTCAFQFKDQVYIGTAQGKVLKEFSGRTFDGEKINFSWKSPWFTWGGGTYWTTTREARFKISEEGASKFHVRTLRDGSSEFKSRIINNDNPNLDSLVWDIGYQAGDETVKSTQTETVPVYKYTTSNNYIFYSLVNTELARTVPIKLFYSDDITGDYTYSTLVTELVDGSEVDNNFVVFEPQDVYAWGRIYDPVPNIMAYKSPSNENLYCWVNRKEGYTSGYINATLEEVIEHYDANIHRCTEVSSNYNRYTFDPANPVLDNEGRFEVNATYPYYWALFGSDYKDYTNKRIKVKYKVRKYYICTGSDLYTVGSFTWTAFSRYTFSLLGHSNNYPSTKEIYDYATDSYEETGNIGEPAYGGDLVNGSVVKTNGVDIRRLIDGRQKFDVYYDLDIDFKTKSCHVKVYAADNPNEIFNERTFNFGYNGNLDRLILAISGYKYNNDSLDSEGYRAYFWNNECSMDIHTGETQYVWNGSLNYKDAKTKVDISNFTEDTIIVNGETWTRDKSKDAQYNPNDMDKIVFTSEATPIAGTEFFYDRSFTRRYSFVNYINADGDAVMDDKEVLSRTSDLDTVNEVPHFYKKEVVSYTNDGEVKQIPNKDYYNYPEPTTDTLTDTVWDEYAWVKTGHITRRILLPNQYFQSLQFEFFGDALDENMYLYGFEVDGIQLTEHPW